MSGRRPRRDPDAPWYRVVHTKASGQKLPCGVAVPARADAVASARRLANARNHRPYLTEDADGAFVIQGLFGKERVTVEEIDQQAARECNARTERAVLALANEAWRDVWAAQCALGLRPAGEPLDPALADFSGGVDAEPLPVDPVVLSWFQRVGTQAVAFAMACKAGRVRDAARCARRLFDLGSAMPELDRFPRDVWLTSDQAELDAVGNMDPRPWMDAKTEEQLDEHFLGTPTAMYADLGGVIATFGQNGPVHPKGIDTPLGP